MTVKKFAEQNPIGTKFYANLVSETTILSKLKIVAKGEVQLFVKSNAWVNLGPELFAQIADREVTPLPTIKAAPKPAGHNFLLFF